MEMKCIKCDGKYKETTLSMVFLNKYIKNDIPAMECEDCGHQIIDLEEGEKIYQEIRKKEQTNLLFKPFALLFAKARMLTSGYVVL